MTEVLFLIGIIGIGYSYLIYPSLLFLVKDRAKTDIPDASDDTFITLIIAAHNEEANISEKLKNSLEQAYPVEQFEILVASDASDDRTDSIVKNFESERVKLVRSPDRLGKEHAQGLAINAARGQIIVFSDAATRLEKNCLARIADRFRDPEVGALSSTDRVESSDGKVGGEGAYVRYEMWLRTLEARKLTLVGLSGSLFAARRDMCDEWPVNVPSDFNVAVNCALAGRRAVIADDVIGIYRDLAKSGNEYGRKVRTMIRGMTGLAVRKRALNPAVSGAFAWQLFSHKVMRWLVPWFGVLSLVVAIANWNRAVFYELTVFVAISVVLIAILAHCLQPLRQISLIRLIYFFIMVNVAAAHASISYLTGKRVTTWNPSSRK